MFSLWCIDWVGGLYADRLFKYFCIKSSVGTQDEVGRLQKCFKPPVVHSADLSKAVVKILVLIFVALWFILRGDLF